jgi:hypothetical protein
MKSLRLRNLAQDERVEISSEPDETVKMSGAKYHKHNGPPAF